MAEKELEPLLSSLVRKEVLGVQADPRSPEHGQYGFLQDLIRHVAYETLSKRERKTRHLAAAEHLESAFSELDEVAEVLASHYLAAFKAAPEADDAQAIRAKAREMLARAGERAGSLGGHNEAASAPLERALTLAERLQLPEVFVQALTSKAVVLLNQGRLAEARILLEAAAARAQTEQLYATALRASQNLGAVLESSDRYAEVLDLVERSLVLARRRGNRRMESVMRTGSVGPLFMLGRWDEALTIAAEEEPILAGELSRGQTLGVALILCERGDLDGAGAQLRASDMLRDSDNWQL